MHAYYIHVYNVMQCEANLKMCSDCKYVVITILTFISLHATVASSELKLKGLHVTASISNS